MNKAAFYREANRMSYGPLKGVIVLKACTTYAGPVAAAELVDVGPRSSSVSCP